MSRLVTARVTTENLWLPAPLPIPGLDEPLRSRAVWYLTLSDVDGHVGRGVAAPLPGFSAEGVDEVEGALRSLLKPGEPLHECALTSVEDLRALMDRVCWPPSVMHAVEQAALSLLAARAETTPAALLAASTTTHRQHRLVHDGWSAQVALAEGAAALKIKVGCGPEALATVRAVRDAVGPQPRIHVDANGRWSADEARAHLRELETLGVALVEEPVAERDLVALAQLQTTTPITLAADESCRTEADLTRILDLRAANAVVLKPMLIGGALRTADLAHRAASAGLEVIVTHCFDGPLGLAWVQLTAGLTDDDALCTISATTATPDVIDHPLAAAAASRPDHPALQFGPETLTYRELADQAARYAHYLHVQGVRPGQTVALRAPIGLEWVVAFHGITWLGAIAAPLDARDLPARALHEQLDTLGPHVVLGPAPAGSWLSLPVTCPGEADHRAPAPWSLGAVRVALTTSGTTGAPRAVHLTTRQLVSSAMASRARLGHEASDRWLACLPLHHVGGLSILLRAVWNRTTVLLASTFDAERVTEQLVGGEASMVSLVPTMLERVLDTAGDTPLSTQLRVILVGGAATSEDLLARCRARSLPVARTWGMTEAASQVATASPGDYAPGLPPLPLVTVTAPQGVLTVAGSLVGTAAMATGDHGWVDASGRVHVTGRRDQIIVSGGENLDGDAIEDALRAHPQVQDACVVALPDTRWGHRPAAYLVADSDARPTVEALRAVLAERLPTYAFPDHLCWVEALPRTALGKVSRRLVTEGLEKIAQSGRDLEGSEVLHVDAGMNVAGGGPNLAIDAPHDGEVEGDRRGAEARDGDPNHELFAHAHRPLEVGLGVHEGHSPPLLVEDLGEGIVHGREERLVGAMAVLENAPKEGDPSAIDLKEAHGQTMFEQHTDSDRRTR